MYLSKLLLQNFRSYSSKVFEFSPASNLIVGSNGSGKSNILESIFFLASSKSFRSATLSQMMLWNQQFTSVRAQVIKQDASMEIEAQLIVDPQTFGIKRRFLIDQVIKTRRDFLGSFNAVVFHPDDLRLVTGSPNRRREFLDNLFSQINWKYASALSQYHKALKHRNELLDLITKNRSSKSELFYWDQSLDKNAKVIHDCRSDFFRFANSSISSSIFSEIKEFNFIYHPSIITSDSLNLHYSRDLSQGHTGSGIHRDDFTFNYQAFPSPDKNLAFWGSRGQQRLAVLALKIAEINYLQNHFHRRPVLLLDDIFSELDADHEALVSKICQSFQSIITIADPVSPSILPDTKIINLL